MQRIVIVVHLIVVVALGGAILLQRSDAGALGGLGGSSGTSGFLTGRGQANMLTRTTAILAAIFFSTSLILGVMAASNRAPRSIIDDAASRAPTSQGGGVLDQLRQMEQQPSAPQVPSTR